MNSRPKKHESKPDGIEAPGVPIQVVFMIDNLGRAGTEQWLLRLISNFDRTKVAPHLVLLDGTSAASMALEPKDVPVLRLGVRSFASFKALSAAKTFVSYLKKNRIRVVQLHFTNSTYFGAPLAWWAGVKKIIATCRNLGYWLTPAHRIASRLTSRFISDIIANSRESRQAASKIYHRPSDEVFVFANGIDVSRFQDISPIRLSKPAGEPWRIGIVANLRPVKDIPTFVHAAAEVLKTTPNVEFLIAGDGPDRTSLQSLVDSLHLAEKVHFLGAIEDIPHLLRSLDLAVLCSKSEGFSNALLEYLAANLPVIATNVGGNLDVIEHERTGLLFPPEDCLQLSQLMTRLLSDRQLSATLAECGRASVSALFTVEQETNSYSNFFILPPGRVHLHSRLLTAFGLQL